MIHNIQHVNFLSVHLINQGDLSQVEGNLTGYEGVYDNWDTEGTGREC